MKKRFSKVVFLSLLLTCIFAIPVLADDNLITIDKAGNVFIVDNDCEITENVDNELYAAGESIKAHDITIDGSAFAAGNNIEIKDCDINGSVYAAGEEIEINAKVNNNINVAGEKITIGESTEAKAIRAAGDKVVIKGSSKNVVVFGNEVYLDGVIEGDINVACSKLTVSDSAKVLGKLSVEAPSEPEIPETVEVGEVEFKESDNNDSDASNDKAKLFEKGAKGVIVGIILKKILKAIYWIIAYFILGILICLLFKNDINNANAMIYERTMPLIASGAIGLITIPVAVIFTFIIFILAPVGGITLALYIFILCLSKIFVFTSVVREYIFTKLIKSEKARNQYIEILLMSVLCVVLSNIPFIKGIVGLICNVLALGYFIQKGYLTLTAKGDEKPSDINNQSEVAEANSDDNAGN